MPENVRLGILALYLVLVYIFWVKVEMGPLALFVALPFTAITIIICTVLFYLATGMFLPNVLGVNFP